MDFRLTFIQVPEFISQRRRWLNGSLFASIHATVFFFRIWTSGQGFFRKIFLQVSILVLLYIQMIKYFSETRLSSSITPSNLSSRGHLSQTSTWLSSSWVHTCFPRMVNPSEHNFLVGLFSNKGFNHRCVQFSEPRCWQIRL